MTAKPIVLNPSTPVTRVAPYFCNRKTKGTTLVVSDAGGVRGIVTETDMMRGILALRAST